MFDGECRMALDPMQGNRASSPGDGEISWCFSSCGGNLGYILELQRGWPFKIHVYSATSELLSSSKGHLLEAWQGNRDASRGEAGDAEFLSISHRDIWIPINFQEVTGIVFF